MNLLKKLNLSRLNKKTVYSLLILLIGVGQITIVHASPIKQTKGDFEDKFRQLDEDLPTPNTYRNAAGEPGIDYWQQQVDYSIDVKLNEDERRIEGMQTVTYHNNSPDTLRYLWVQLDQNRFRTDSISETTKTFGNTDWRDPAAGNNKTDLSLKQLQRMQWLDDNKPGYQISDIVSQDGVKLHTVTVGTQMRIDLPQPLKSGETFTYSLKYKFKIVDADLMYARSGYEHFPDDARKGGNDIFLVAQWYPRLHAYTDYEAWHNKPFIGSGEFTLEFGDYDVNITVPADHIVSSTGELQNPEQVLTETQRDRLEQAKTAKRPVFIVTPEEALENEKKSTSKTKTWQFSAKNVRDFAWASSRKFAWDAKGFKQEDAENPLVMAMSFYPKEGGELWQKYSTEAVVHAMEVYSRFSFDYPYAVAQSVNGPVGGMEYPMITFNGPRTIWHKDNPRTYTLAEKQFLILVVIHEIGHIYFPMTVNSDERQWTWMDEGINTFLESVATREWDDATNIPWDIEARDIVDYMKSDKQVPIMTQSDSVLRLGPNAYLKPTVALNILREVILGRELFDFAFKEYARRWMFKRPTPSDFFRTMEEASGVDLDWFWRGWFYTTDHVDIAIDNVYEMRLESMDPEVVFSKDREFDGAKPTPLFMIHNKEEDRKTWVERNKDVRDFHDKYDRFTVTNAERNEYAQMLADLSPEDRQVFDRALKEDKYYYVLDFSNHGGLVMPILLQATYKNGKTKDFYIPAEIWRKSPQSVSKLIVSDKQITQFTIDPHWETADVNNENNYYPRRIIPSRLEIFMGEDELDDFYTERDIMKDFKSEIEEPEVEPKRK